MNKSRSCSQSYQTMPSMNSLKYLSRDIPLNKPWDLHKLYDDDDDDDDDNINI